jgi:Ca2+-binding RTX toxin-like protein
MQLLAGAGEKNPWAANPNYQATNGSVNSLKEGATKGFTLALESLSDIDRTITLSVDQLASKIGIVRGDTIEYFDTGTVDVKVGAGKSEVSFSLWQKGDIDDDTQVQLTATLDDPNGGEPVSSNLILDYDADDEATAADIVTTRDIIGGALPIGQTTPYRNKSEDVQLEEISRLHYLEHFNETNGSADDLGNPTLDYSQPEATDDTLRGSTGKDNIVGGDGRGFLFGFGGDDHITGGMSKDYIEGDAGNDLLEGKGGVDIIVGGDGNDRIYGDVKVATDTDEAIHAIDSANGINQMGDFLSGGDGNDTIVGGARNDIIFGGDGSDLLIGGAGDDVIQGNVPGVPLAFTSSVTKIPEGYLFTGFDMDLQPATGGNDTIYAGSGNDAVFVTTGTGLVLAGTGADFVHGGIGNDTIFGEEGNDSIWGDTTGPNTSRSIGGDDFIDGGGRRR